MSFNVKNDENKVVTSKHSSNTNMNNNQCKTNKNSDSTNNDNNKDINETINKWHGCPVSDKGRDGGRANGLAH